MKALLNYPSLFLLCAIWFCSFAPVKAQEGQASMGEKFLQRYGAESGFSMAVQVDYYQKGASSPHTVKGTVSTQKEGYYTEMGGKIRLQNKSGSLIVNHGSKQMDWFAPEQQQEQQQEPRQTALEQMPDFSHFLGEEFEQTTLSNGQVLFYKHYEKGQLQYRSFQFDSDGTLLSAEQHFATTATQSMEKVVITYSNHNFNPSLPKEFFSETAFLQKEDTQLIQTREYESYILNIHNTSAQ